MQIGQGKKLDDKVYEAFGLALLLLPPNNRRQLHLLLRLMSKMCLFPEIYRSVLPRGGEGLRMYLRFVFWP